MDEKISNDDKKVLLVKEATDGKVKAVTGWMKKAISRPRNRQRKTKQSFCSEHERSHVGDILQKDGGTGAAALAHGIFPDDRKNVG